MKGVIKKRGMFFVFLILLLAFVSFFYGNYLTGDIGVLNTLIPFVKNIEFPAGQNILVSDIYEEIQYGPSGRGLVSVVQVRDVGSADNGGFWTGSNGYYFEHYDRSSIKEMLNNAVIILSGEANAGDAWDSLVPYVPGEQIALKLNMNCQGTESNYYDANPAFVDAMAEVLNENLGVPLNDLYFYDPSHPYPREMKRYRDQYFDNNFYFGRPMNGEDNPYPGFGDDYGGANDPPDDNYINIITAQTPLGCADTTNGYILDDAGGHPNYIPLVLTEAEHEITISLLKNHGLGEGGTFTMKNQGVGTPQVDINDGSWCGSFSRNSAEQSLHDDHICAAINANEHIHGKTRLAIIDGIYGQLYPHSMAEPEDTWSSFGDQPPALILASTDPVAVDSVANYLLEVEDRAAYGGTGSVYDTADSEGTTWIQCVKYAEEEQGIGVYESWDEVQANGGFVDIDYLIYGEAECEDGQTRDCYDGPEETSNVGICHNGTQSCIEGFWGACEGQQLPLQEDCEDLGNEDEDCDGFSNEEDEDCLTCVLEEIFWGDVSYNLLTDVEEPSEVYMIVNTTACIGEQMNLNISEYDGGVLDYEEDNFVGIINDNLELYPWTTVWNLDDDGTPDISEYRFNTTIVGVEEEISGLLNVLVDSTVPVFLDHDGDYNLINVNPGSTQVVFEWNTSEPTNYTLSIDGNVESSESIFDNFRIVTVSDLLSETDYDYELEVCDARDNCVGEIGVFTTGPPLSNFVLNYTHLEDTYIANTGGHDNDSYGNEDLLHLDGEIGGGGRGNILMRWDVASLLGTEIENARLYLYTDDSYTSGIQEYIEIYPMVESRWTENEATFLEWVYSNNQMLNKWSGTDIYTGYSWTLLSPGDYNNTLINGSLHYDDDGEWHIFDVTSLIQGWVDGSFDSDAGMVLFAPNLYGEGSPYYIFASSEYSDIALRPRIEVEMAGSSSSDCQLIGAYWEWDGSNDDVDEGDLVELTVFGTDCAGEQISFDIREDDTIGGTDAWGDADLVDIDVYPTTVTFDEGGNLDWARGSWVAEWHEDDNGGIGDPEYIFRGSLVSNNNIIADSVDELSVALLSCSELGGNICVDGQSCDGFSVPSSDGDCCMGTCRECDITNAEWSETEVLEGTQVSLNVDGDWCDGQNISFDVREDDQLIGSNWDNADVIILDNPPANATFSGTQASVSWISEWHDDIDGGDNDPEYVFRTSLGSNPLVIRDSSNELKVNGVVSSGDTYYVDDDNIGGPWDGSETNPFFYIQDGVNILQAGDTLIIKDGIYYGFSENQEIFDTVNSGISGNPITIRAENNYQVFVDGLNLNEGHNNVLIDQSYIILEGIISQNAKQSGIQLWGADHSKILRCGSSDPKDSASAIGLIDSSYNLIEECFVWGHGRYPIGITSSGISTYNILRKNVVRFDYSITHEPKSCYTNYHQSWNFFFNNLCIDSKAEVYYPGTEESNQVPSGFMTSNGFYDLTYRGNMVLNHEGNAFLMEGSDSRDIVMHNNIAWDVKRGGILLVNDLDLSLFYFSTENLDPILYTFDLEHYTMGNVEGGVGFDAKTSVAEKVDVTNSIFYNVDSRSDRSALSSDYDSDYNVFYMNDNDRGSADYGTHDYAENLGNGINPLDNGLMYLPRIESGSVLGEGSDDGQGIGATILYQIGESETLYGEPGWDQIQYDEPLWPWPNEEAIKQHMGNHYRAEGHYLEGPWISCTVDVNSDSFNCPGHSFEEGDVISFTATTFPESISQGGRFVPGIEDHYVYRVLCVNGDEFTIRTRTGGTCEGYPPDIPPSVPDDILTQGSGVRVALGWNNPIFDGNRGFAAAESLTHYIWEYLGNPCPDDICGESEPECQIDGDCNDGVSCTVDSCVAENCVYTPDNSVCDNGAYCDGAEICDLNLDCQAGAIIDCNDGVSCTVDSCNEGTDSCDNLADDSICDDGQWCNGEDYCSITLDCQVQNIPDCDDTVGCTIDSCNEGTDSCDNTPNDAYCDNDLWCDGVETCDIINDCQAGTNVDCSDIYDCTDDSCNDVLDICENTQNDDHCIFPEVCNIIYFPPPSGCGEIVECTGQDDGTPCDDGIHCNGVDECLSESCVNVGPAVDCGDGVDCTDDSCNEETDGCDNIPNDSYCDNDLWCDGTETCDSQLDCLDGVDVDCDDQIDCTIDSCDEAIDECVYDDSGCSDFILNLYAGEWNYISIPIDMDDNDVAQLGAHTVLAYDSVNEAWAMNFGPFEQISTLEPLKGYIVTVPEDKSIEFSGEALEPLQLEVDMWNLVGVNESGLINDIYSGAGTIVVYEWDDNLGELVFIDPSVELQPGTGYWIGVGDVESPPEDRDSGVAGKLLKGLVRIFGYFVLDTVLPSGNLLISGFS
jgi:hypothetical protein